MSVVWFVTPYIAGNMTVEVRSSESKPVRMIVPAAHPQQPRVDHIVAVIDSSGNRTLKLLPGTPTVGANFSNYSGVQPTPNNAEHVAYILVHAGATQIFQANIHHDALENAVTALEAV